MTTDSPTSGLSSASTFCIKPHCSDEAPAGVSQRIDHAPCVDLTEPCCCALAFEAGTARARNAARIAPDIFIGVMRAPAPNQLKTVCGAYPEKKSPTGRVSGPQKRQKMAMRYKNALTPFRKVV